MTDDALNDPNRYYGCNVWKDEAPFAGDGARLPSAEEAPPLDMEAWLAEDPTRYSLLQEVAHSLALAENTDDLLKKLLHDSMFGLITAPETAPAPRRVDRSHEVWI